MATCSECGKDLAGDFAFCPFCGAAVSSPATRSREQRKVVTVLFCDVTGSTALGEQLDPEALRNLLARYFERMKAIVERHGGTVEKFIGDAVMAVFGVPVVHEDDALRALRAAVEMRDALPELGVQGRIGVTTGEVVTGTEERLATGDAVNVAARLEQAAQPGEILIGPETLGLTRDAVEVAPVAPLALKGKSEPVTAHRLVAVHGDEGVTRHAATPMVGRDNELRRLRNAYDQAVADGSCQLFTILGPAGVGKSRLVAEFLASLGGALVARGRCLPYGEGITYWPIVAAVKQLPAVELDPAVEPVIAALLGEQQRATSTDEIAWAFRKLLEAVAASQTLVCVFDDVHWGEETFLDLLEHVADLSRDAPILLLCIARPELLDRRPGWSGGKVNATSVLLEPLGPDESNRLIDSLAELDDGLRERIRDAAEGNPLFVEQMVAYAREFGGAEVTVPPTIQALLAARLDQLDEADRAVLERGAVEGRVFHRRAVEALAPDEAQVGTRLTSLVRKELVRPDRPLLAGDDAFRFRHLLIRDAAYDALPKAMRAELHERFAVWLEEFGADLVELDEILGYHLEQAHGYLVQLGDGDDHAVALGVRAATRLRESAGRALARGDMRAAVQLFDRAAVLLSANDERRLRLLPSLGRALTELGDWKRADAVLSEAVARARAAGDETTAADASIALTFIRIHTETDSSHAKVRPEIERAIEIFEQNGSEAELARALALGGMLRFWRGEVTAALVELERAAAHARVAGDLMQERETLASVLMALLSGPAPVASALEHLARIAGRAQGAPRLELAVAMARAAFAAMRGEIAQARDSLASARTLAAERGAPLTVGFLRVEGEVELAAGNVSVAEAKFRELCRTLEDRGDWGHYVTAVPYLADALHAQGRAGEVADAIEAGERLMIDDDIDAQVGLRRVHARLLAEQGELARAERLGREAVEVAAKSEFVRLHAEALLDVAFVFERTREHDAAVAALEDARALFDAKGDIVGAARAGERLAALRTASR